MAPAELSPNSAQANQQVVTSSQSGKLSPAQLAWSRFVEKVERGEQVDPTGQYVSKTTVLQADDERLTRPKHDAAEGVPEGLIIKADGTVTSTGSQNLLADPDDPPVVCPEGCPGTPVFYSTFTTSENKGGSGYIHDLKIATVGVVEQTSYIKLEADLNKGAGGAYINLAFTRNSNDVISGREYYSGKANSAPSDILTSFTTKIADGWWDNPSPADHYFYMWAPTRATYPNLLNPYTAWDYQDLNDGAGGEYIYSFQSKSSQIPAYIGQISEIGILSGNSSTINPSAGWIKYPRDLNEGAGGDYIYFCYKY